MLAALTTLLVFQLIGEMLAIGLGLPVPGPVVGMALLFLALIWRPQVNEKLGPTAQSLLQHLSLLFVPAGTGVMLHTQRLADEWLPIVFSLLVSTVLAIVMTAGVMHLLMKRRGG